MKVAAVIPCYRVRDHILGVLAEVPALIHEIYVVDDACPEESGKWVLEQCRDPRVQVLTNSRNLGVGGATVAGMTAALAANAEIVVKIDGDGQMRLDYLEDLLAPLIAGLADCAKANRFYDLEALQMMPLQRRLGNFGLSIATKFASGNWNVSDPTNGFVAMHAAALRRLSLTKMAPRYFFEISLLVQLNIVGAVVIDVPVPTQYGAEKSSLSSLRCLVEFPGKLALSLLRRIYWRYFVFNVNAVSLFLVLGTLLTAAGIAFGAHRMIVGISTNTVQTAGTVAFSFLPIILGFQMLLQAVLLDIVERPQFPLQRLAHRPTVPR